MAPDPVLNHAPILRKKITVLPAIALNTVFQLNEEVALARLDLAAFFFFSLALLLLLLVVEADADDDVVAVVS
jgi:hypothetical protein